MSPLYFTDIVYITPGKEEIVPLPMPNTQYPINLTQRSNRPNNSASSMPMK
jgi:hypothetical protein